MASMFFGSPVQLDALQPRQKLLPQDAHFHAAEMLAKADMGAVAERDVLVGRALDVVVERVGEHGLVAIARRVAQHQPVALGDLLPRDFGVGGGRAHEVLHRRDPADRLFDMAGDQRGIGLQLAELVRVLRQRPHAAGGGV